MGSVPSKKLTNDQTVVQGFLQPGAEETLNIADTNTNAIGDASSVSDTTLESHQIKPNVFSGKEENKKRQSETSLRDINEKEECTTDAEDFEKYKERTFERLRTLKIILSDNIDLTTEVETELMFLSNIYFFVQEMGFSRTVYEGYQKVLSDVLLELDLLSQFVKILDDIPKDTDFRSATPHQKQVIAIIIGALHNYTDLSDPFANAVAKSRVMDFTKEILDANYDEYISDASKRFTKGILTSCHGISHNVSMREANVERLRDLDYTTSLAPYLKSTDPMDRISVLATLANIVTEKECEIISNHILVVGQLLMLLNEGMTSESRRCNGWSCRECALAVRQLARNDANKKLLYELKAVETLVELAKSDDEEEKLESLLAILALSFDDKLRVEITTKETLGVIDVLLDLKNTSKNNDIKSACERTLWNLKDDLLSSAVPSYRAAGEQMQQKNETCTKTGHVMISYNRNDREVLLPIKEKLKELGFKVWMDVDEMGGCVYETMANAVENANVFLMCYSKKYKESNNCRYEAKYAHKRNKAVLPLKMEMGYEPDGWLGLLLSSDYFIEFSGKYDNEEKFAEMVAKIRKVWPTGQDHIDAPIIPKVQQPVLANRIAEVGAVPTKRQSTSERQEEKSNLSSIVLIKKWCQDDVDKWLESHDLKNQGLNKLSGLEISYLTLMFIEAPEQLHYCLRNDLKIKTLSTKARFVWALRDLANKEE